MPALSDLPDLATAPEVAAAIGVKPHEIWRAARAGLMPAVATGLRRWHVPVRVLEKMLRGEPVDLAPFNLQAQRERARAAAYAAAPRTRTRTRKPRAAKGAATK